MRKFALLIWLLIPAVAAAYHYGPGQERLVLDEVARLVAIAEKNVEDGDFGAAAVVYDKALQSLPQEKVAATRRLRLERDKAWMLAKKLPEAHQDLTNLLADINADENADPKLAREVRATLANSQYYMTWLMRLEGRPREDWEPVVEASRQSFRLLAEETAKSGKTAESKKHQEDLEAAIRLARLDLKELQGLPLPSQ